MLRWFVKYWTRQTVEGLYLVTANTDSLHTSPAHATLLYLLRSTSLYLILSPLSPHTETPTGEEAVTVTLYSMHIYIKFLCICKNNTMQDILEADDLFHM